MRTRTAVALWTVALLLAASAAGHVFMSHHPDASVTRGVLATVVGLAFVGAGLGARYRRPENRTGVIMILVGFSWFFAALLEAGHRVPFTIGVALAYLAFGFFAWLVLAYPSGRLETRLDGAIVAGAFLVVTVGRIPWMVFNDLRDDFPNGPENLLLVDHNPRAYTAIETVVQATALVLIAATIAVLVRRWRAATPTLRRVLSPVFLSSGATVSVLAVWLAMDAFDVAGQDAVYVLVLVALLTVPLSFLLGLLRSRLATSSVGRLVVELGERRAPGDLRDALARALGDPSLEVAYRLDGRTYVDVEGRHVELPPDGSGRVTMVEHEGECIAALVHDPSLKENPVLLEGVTAAAALALENERRLAALAESEARNRALLDALPDLMFRISRDGIYLDVKGDERDLARPPAELIGSNIFDVLPEDAAERIMRCARKAHAGGGVETVEYQLTLDGVVRDFEARIVPSGEDEVLLVVRDFTERNRAEAELRALEDELRVRFEELRRERDFIRDVVHASASIFCVVTPGGRIVRFNRALEELSGHPDDDAVRGRPFWEVFVAPDESDDVRNVLADVVSESTPREHENRWLAHDGAERVVAWSATQLRDAEGRPRVLISGLDVTARKHQEEELRRLYGELEERLEELQASRARIVEAGAEERRRLERNLHDGAQQRLVAISLMLRLAERRLDSDTVGAQELLGTASAELGLALEELRELARGIHPAVLTHRGLGPALEALVTRMPVPVNVAETPEPRLPEPVEAAAYYVVSEALANVAKYAEASEATVRVCRDDGRAVVEVADDGVGGADPGRGSGLRGLADRIEALDGYLEVESPPGGGTTVRAQIPCA